MHLVPVNIDSILLKQPLPFALMDKDGVLLAKKNYVIASRKDLEEISQRGGGLFIDVADSEAHHRAYVDRLHGLVRDGKALGEIADTKISANMLNVRTPSATDERPDWLDLQAQGNALLRDRNPTQFLERLERVQTMLSSYAHRNPDGALFALVYLAGTETRMYSATHSMLVSLTCGLTAREILKWPRELEVLLCKAALTMNLSLTALQDQLAAQADPPTAAQLQTIDEHPAKSAEMLSAMGIRDATWLQAVREHHIQMPGPMEGRTTAQQFVRLMQRADMFADRLAPKAGRSPLAPAAAMQACYFDENRQMDEAGAALIKAVGIYQPGSFVRLATDEVAVVIKRGHTTTTPRVAVLINRSGMPTIEHTIRETSLRDFRIVASLPYRDVKVKINLERLLPLTATPERSW